MTESNFKQNFVFDMYEYSYGPLSLMVSQFNCNCIPFGISLGHKWHFAKTSGSTAYSSLDNIYFLLEELGESLFNCTFHCLLLCTKEPSRRFIIFPSKVLICIFKHSMDALTVAAQWLTFKHIFAFE